ncbi:MAG: oligosaccharide flippase family protein [Bacteroidales bacterium]
MSFRKTFFKNVIILGGYSYSNQIIKFLATIVLSRLLLPEEYGFIALITVFTGFISQFSDAGLSFIVIRSDYKERFYQMMHYLSFIIGILLFLILLLLAYPITLFYKDSALLMPTIVLGANFVLQSLTIVPYGILQKKLDFNGLGLIDFLSSIFEILMMILLAFLGFSYWSLVIPTVLGTIARIFMYYSKTGLKFQILKRKYLVVGFRKARSIIGNLTGFNLVNYWSRNMDNLVIGRVYGADSLGIYNRAYRLLSMVTGIITSLFGKVLYPSLKDLSNKGGDVKKEYFNLLGVISLANFPIAVVLIFFSEPLVRILWSETWIKVAQLLPYVGILILTQTLNSTSGNIYILYNKENMLFRVGIPTSLAVIGAILWGAFYSYVHVLLFYTITIVCFDIPVNLVYGFKKSFGYSTKEIIYFWMPKLLLSVVLIISVWYNFLMINLITCGVYLVHLIIKQRQDISSVLKFGAGKLRNSKIFNRQ